jgi:Ser/Thr protein kinase RdoA (MazF antagonist)
MFRPMDRIFFDKNAFNASCGEGFPPVPHADEALLGAARSALRARGADVDGLHFIDSSAEGSYAEMRVLVGDSLPDKMAMVIKKPWPSSEGDPGLFNAEVEGQVNHHAEHLVSARARNRGVPTPRFIASHADVGDGALFSFSIQDYVDGKTASDLFLQRPDTVTEVMEAMAYNLAALHTIRPDRKSFGGLDRAAATDGLLIGRYAEIRNHYMAALNEALLSMEKTRVMGRVACENIRRFFMSSPLIDRMGCGPTRVLHGDFGPHNTIVSEENKSKPTAIDFGFALTGPVEYDLAVLEDLLGMSGRREHWKDFLRVYEQAGGILVDEFELTYSATFLRVTLSRLGGLAALRGKLPAAHLPRVNEIMQRTANTVRQEADRLGILLPS